MSTGRRHDHCSAEIGRLRAALTASLALQCHYATLLNAFDGGQRLTFSSIEAWLARLDETAKRANAKVGPLRLVKE